MAMLFPRAAAATLCDGPRPARRVFPRLRGEVSGDIGNNLPSAPPSATSTSAVETSCSGRFAASSSPGRGALVRRAPRLRERLREPTSQRPRRIARDPCPGPKAPIDSALRSARQPRKQQSKQKQHHAHDNHTGDKHKRLLRSTQPQRPASGRRYARPYRPLASFITLAQMARSSAEGSGATGSAAPGSVVFGSDPATRLSAPCPLGGVSRASDGPRALFGSARIGGCSVAVVTVRSVIRSLRLKS